MWRDYIRGCFQVGPDSRFMASEAGSFIDDEGPQLLTLQVASRALFLVKTTLECRLFFSFCFLGKLKFKKEI